MKKIISLVLITIFCTSAMAYVPETGSDAEKTKKGWAFIPDPELPNVLILGDSISIGYTRQVKELLADKANVFRPLNAAGTKAANCQGTTLGVQKINRWLGSKNWTVIHFNWGLHDLKHVDAITGENSDSFDDPQQADPEQYRKNLIEIVDKLKATGAKLIFATTTPYPEGVSPARLPSDVKVYNDIACEIMKANGIEINDLNALCIGKLDSIQKPKNVHFNAQGNTVLSSQVANVIEKALGSMK